MILININAYSIENLSYIMNNICYNRNSDCYLAYKHVENVGKYMTIKEHKLALNSAIDYCNKWSSQSYYCNAAKVFDFKNEIIIIR